MKTVLFVSYSMGIGGVEKALLGAINKFRKDEWGVHLALLKPEGEFLEFLPQDVKILSIDCFNSLKQILHTPLYVTAKQALKKGRLSKGLKFAYLLLKNKIDNGYISLYNDAFKNINTFNSQEYDLAIAFAGPFAFIDYFTARKVKAKEKWGWIHFDISKFGVDHSIIKDVYKDFSLINVVSEDGRAIFNSTFPEFKEKTKFTPNIVDADSIKRMACEKVGFEDGIANDGKIHLLTVGRISREKGQFTAIQALEILILKGIKNLEWWFVGDGSDMQRCRDYVTQSGLTDYVKFWGAMANPYPYMQMCDLYVQPSEHEGFCITLAEAKLFHKPIVATDFTGAHEQLNVYEEPNAISSHSPEDLAEKINEMLSCLPCSD